MVKGGRKRDANRSFVGLLDRATEMDVTMVGLQNAGKSSLLRVLAVSILMRREWFAFKDAC